MKRRGAIVIGPAWESCGSHQLFKAQLRALAAMGMETYFLAVAPVLSIVGEQGDGWWAHYREQTGDLGADARGEATLSSISNFRPGVLLGKLAARRRTSVFWRTMPARLADAPASLRDFIRSHQIEALLCNHYFNLPLARRIQKWSDGVKIVCETQDIQSRHMIVSDPRHPLTGAPGHYEQYFRDELRCCGAADEFIHLNEEEFSAFAKQLPTKRHHLLYPALPRPPRLERSPKLDIDFLIVASNNRPNFNSLRWFLDEVWDRKLNRSARLRIVGNVDVAFQHEASDYLTRYGPIFMGRVDDVGPWYHRARTVLAPTIEGQGISIKTIEALSYGRPFIYSPLAVRGFDRQIGESLPGLCRSAAEFKSAIKARLPSPFRLPKREINKEALEIYETLFAPEAYQRRFQQIFAPTDR